MASDVAKSLGYINAKDAVKRHVDDDDSMLLQVSDNQWGVKRSILKTRYIDSIRIINESGLYSLILSSKLESAKRFKKWVTSEVLPSIRKTGEYKTSSGGMRWLRRMLLSVRQIQSSVLTHGLGSPFRVRVLSFLR